MHAVYGLTFPIYWLVDLGLIWACIENKNKNGMEINLLKYIKIHENEWKWMKMNENEWKREDGIEIAKEVYTKR